MAKTKDHRLSIPEMKALRERWAELSAPGPEGKAFYQKISIAVRMEIPLGELANPENAGFIFAWELKGIPDPTDITDENSFNAQGLEGKISFPVEQLSTALLVSDGTGFGRINIFVSREWANTKLPELIGHRNEEEEPEQPIEFSTYRAPSGIGDMDYQTSYERDRMRGIPE